MQHEEPVRRLRARRTEPSTLAAPAPPPPCAASAAAASAVEASAAAAAAALPVVLRLSGSAGARLVARRRSSATAPGSAAARAGGGGARLRADHPLPPRWGERPRRGARARARPVSGLSGSSADARVIGISTQPKVHAGAGRRFRHPLPKFAADATSSAATSGKRRRCVPLRPHAVCSAANKPQRAQLRLPTATRASHAVNRLRLRLLRATTPVSRRGAAYQQQLSGWARIAGCCGVGRGGSRPAAASRSVRVGCLSAARTAPLRRRRRARRRWRTARSVLIAASEKAGRGTTRRAPARQHVRSARASSAAATTRCVQACCVEMLHPVETAHLYPDRAVARSAG